MGVAQNQFYHSVKECEPRKNYITTKKLYLLWNTGHFDENTDV